MKIKRLLTVLTTALLLTACGTNDVTESTAESTTATTIESEVTKNTSSEPTEPIAESIVEPSTAPEPTPSPASTWIAENQIVITPQGDFSQVGNLYNSYTYELVDTLASPAHITITETTENVADGYKKVIATKTVDAAYADEYGFNTAYKAWFSAFDKYTGYSFEATTGTGSRENSFLINANGKEYDISFQFHTTGPADNATAIIEIICPVDYDGTVFQVGPASLYDELVWSTLDMSERLYTIDEFPFFGNDFLYFTYTND